MPGNEGISFTDDLPWGGLLVQPQQDMASPAAATMSRTPTPSTMPMAVVTALDALYNLYGVHYAIENPRASLRLRPLMLSLVQSERVRLDLVNYCQYNHIFAKDTNVRTTVGWTP